MIDLIVDEDPCESYLEVCCTKEDTSTTSTTPTANRKGCGFRNQDGVGFHITSNNDSESEFGEFPWMVAVIHEQNGYQCGGALIHPQVVITAAHCVKAKEKKYKIRAGEWDTQTNIELYPHQEREVKTIVIHPEFYVRNLSNDIAMLILASPVDLAEHIQTVCLPPQNTVIDTGRCYITGWGKDVFDKEGKYSVILNRVDLPIVERNDCQKKLRTTRLGILFELHKSFICAGGDPERDRCKGDSGSPLVCPIPNSENRFYQMGIAAWSIGCGVNNIPGAYVNIPLFRNWIDDQMKLNNFDTNTYQY